MLLLFHAHTIFTSFNDSFSFLSGNSLFNTLLANSCGWTACIMFCCTAALAVDMCMPLKWLATSAQNSWSEECSKECPEDFPEECSLSFLRAILRTHVISSQSHIGSVVWGVVCFQVRSILLITEEALLVLLLLLLMLLLLLL